MSAFAAEFVPLEQMIRGHARATPERTALADDSGDLGYGDLDRLMDRGAAWLADRRVGKGDVVALGGSNSVAYAAIYLAAVRAGAVPAPLPTGVAADALSRMVSDSGAKVLFHDERLPELNLSENTHSVPLAEEFSNWSSSLAGTPCAVQVSPDDWFNIIYSSGTTGIPKGIIQTHRMRHMHILLGRAHGYSAESITLLSTPLYSNTTLVSFFATMGAGGTAVFMPRFDPLGFLERAERWRVTHAMLVPVQYQRLVQLDQFDRFDLSNFQVKFCTSAPFAAELKQEVLRRWPGGLIEYYGMTEGGGLCILEAHNHPDKLHTVGYPAPQNDIRLIDDVGREIPRTEIGEVVGRSISLMPGYLNRPEETANAFWTSPDGNRFMRTGDIGRFDEDGFLTLMDRKKDVIISGGFNVYPSDLEAIVSEHPDVSDVAVVGVPSDRWGETPVAFIVGNATVSTEDVKGFVNDRVGKTQRLADVRLVDQLPRSAIGKVLKRELRDNYAAAH
jgi:long-chain acyl-CoA synthetase